MSIPASDIVGAIPSVLSAGGSDALLSGLFLTKNPLMPALQVLSFPSTDAVIAFFGLASDEAALAPTYFKGYDNSPVKPSAMLFAAFNLTARAAFLQSGNLSALTEAEWQAMAGSMSIVVDGYTRTALGLNFSALSSQSAVATAIATGLNGFLTETGAAATCSIAAKILTVASTVTGSFVPGQTLAGASVTAGSVIVSQLTSTETDSHLGGKGTYQLSAASTVTTPEAMTSSADIGSAADGSISTTTLTIASAVTGYFAPGQLVTCAGITSNSVILSQLTSTETDGHLGGMGTYQLSQSSTIAGPVATYSTGVPVTVAWDSVQTAFVITSGLTGVLSSMGYATGAVAEDLSLSAATAAYVSAGDAVDTPATAMDKAVAVTQNFCGFTTMWEPSLTDKLNFTIWSNGQLYNPYLYTGWDTDSQAIMQNVTEPFGCVINAAKYNGVIAISGDPNAAYAAGITLSSMLLSQAAFLLGAIASVNFAQPKGRITFMFKSQSGLPVGVTNLQIKTNLVANGYNFYGEWASKANKWSFFAPGQIPGQSKWLDPFVNQIWMADQFQVADMNLLTAVGIIPYDEGGYGLLRAVKLDTINAALNFGAIVPGVALSAAEIAEVNIAAGQNVASIIATSGWYLQILDPGATIRAARGTPIQNFWFTDGGGIQKLVLNSIDMQ